MSNCKHMSFKVIEHEECPECGETDVHKIIDERGIAKLEMMIQEKDAEIERLTTTLENMCQRLEQIQYDHNTCDGDLVLEEARAAIAKTRGEI